MLLTPREAPVAIKVLVVDDEPVIVESLAEILEGAGYSVWVATSGDQALRTADEARPDILLSDVLMPGMNGFELALQVKERFPECRLMLFSGQASTAQLAQEASGTFTRLGYRYELLPKPLHPNALLQRLQQSLTRAA